MRRRHFHVGLILIAGLFRHGDVRLDWTHLRSNQGRRSQ
jgi:hypothetical protein